MAEKKEVEQLVAAFVACRDSLNGHRKEFKKVEAEHKEDMESLASALMDHANELGVDSFKTPSGTAFKKEGFRIVVREWDAALDYIIEHDLKHLLNKSVSKTAAKEFMDENKNQLPPGLKFEGMVEIQVRRK